MFKGPLSPYMDSDWLGSLDGVCRVATGLQCVCGVGLFRWSLGHSVMVEDRLCA